MTHFFACLVVLDCIQDIILCSGDSRFCYILLKSVMFVLSCISLTGKLLDWIQTSISAAWVALKPQFFYLHLESVLYIHGSEVGQKFEDFTLSLGLSLSGSLLSGVSPS